MEKRWLINFVLPIGLMIYGYLYKYKASKKRSRFFGYRTAATELSKETWKYANIRVGEIWMKLGGIYTIFIVFLLLIFPSQRNKLSVIGVVLGAGITLYPFSKIEKELKENFDHKGEPI